MIEIQRFQDAPSLFAKSAQSLLVKRPKVLGLAAGRTPIALYQEIVRHHTDQLKQTHFFHLDEFLGSDVTNPPSFAHQLRTVLFKPLATKETHIHYLSGRAPDPEKEALRYEADIQSLGGIDLQILGLGTNGHLAFNEPRSDFQSRTRVVTLTDETKIQNQDMFPGRPVPDQALSMGLGTILDAKEIWIFVTQESKLEILKKTLFQKPNIEVPASCLQGHSKVTLWTTLKI